MTREAMLALISAIMGGSLLSAIVTLMKARRHTEPERDKIIVSSAEQTVVTMAKVNERTMTLLAERDQRIDELEAEVDIWRAKAREKDLRIDELETTCYRLKTQARDMQEQLEVALAAIAKLKKETREADAE